MSNLNLTLDDTKFKCDQCTQTFGLYKDLQRHVNTKHTSTSVVFCDKCTFSCNRLDSLKRHKRTKHTLLTNDNRIDPFDTYWRGLRNTHA